MPRCKNNRGHPGNYLPVRAIASRMSRIIHHKLGNTDKILNDFFSASSVVSSHGPSAAAKEHEKRILESILPPDLRCKPLLYCNSRSWRTKASTPAWKTMIVMVNVDKNNFQASYQRRSQRQHFPVDSG